MSTAQYVTQFPSQADSSTLTPRELGREGERIAAEYLRVCGPHYTQRRRPPEILARVTQRPEVSEHFFRGEILHFDLNERLGEIRCPVLLLAGELDPIVTIADAEELAAALPPDRLRVERFPDAGHQLAIEQPEAVLALIREFVLEEP